MPHPVLEVRSVSKSFGAVRALRDVSLSVAAGEVRGLVGGNGSGKSTLVKALAGVHAVDSGELLVAGEPLGLGDGEARSECRFVHQDLGLIPEMTVAENLGLGTTEGAPLTPIHGGAEARHVQSLLDSYGLPFEASTAVASLSAASRTMVALIRALHMKGGRVELLVLDEVTATLPPHEIDIVFDAVRKVVAEGTAVLFVSHKMKEVLELCDSVTVFRDGEMVGTLSTESTGEQELVERIVGRPLTSFYVHPRPSGEAVAMEARDLTGRGIRNVDLTLHQREIVGITSIDPAQPRHLLRLLYRAETATAGTISVGGEQVGAHATTHDLIERGVSLVANRTEGGIGVFSVQENLTLNNVSAFMRRGILDGRAERGAARSLIERFNVRPADGDVDFAALSGGNQQKVVLAKSMQVGPRVLLLDDPTQGVDIGAKATIYEILRGAAADGLAVLIASTDIEELCGICHRVVVLKEGRVSGVVAGDSLTPETVLERCYVEAAPGAGDRG
jgi:ribose transport system ATP-binding protein